MMMNKHLLSRAMPFVHTPFSKQLLFFFLMLACGFTPHIARAAMIDGIDIQQRGAETYVYIHTNETVEHQVRTENSHEVSVLLEDVSVFGGQLPIHYENAPRIKHVMLEHLGPKQIKLTLDGSHLKAPIVGFRESAVVPIRKADEVTPSVAVASNFLALSQETNTQEATPPTNIHPLMPTALEASVAHTVTPGISHSLQNRSYSNAVLDIVGNYYVKLLQWAKSHRFLLTMILLAGLSTLFVAHLVSRLVFAKLERNNSKQHTNATERSTLEMQHLVGFDVKPGLSHPVTPQLNEVNEHRLNRIREKMKQQGYAVTPQSAPEKDVFRETSDVNLTVKEAIARRKSQQYLATGTTTQKPRGSTDSNTPVTPQTSQPQASIPTLAGNGFLHAMAEYMDTPSKEHIAKAIQQSKLKQ